MNRFLSLLCLILALSSAKCSLFANLYKVDANIQRDFKLNQLGEPHYFTKHIEIGDIETAKSKGLVDLSDELLGLARSETQNFTSYAGYFTVNKKCNSNLYSWFFQNKNKSAPILLWLEGGPGGSSMFGLFTQNGPYYVDKDQKLNLREYAWTKKYSVLYVDNPVGTGFSYTDKDECYARNQTQVSKDLFSLLIQFFSMFPDLKQNEFYLSGNSYAGKYVPFLAHTIHHHKDFAKNYFNFRGMAISGSWTDPVNQLDYDELLYQIGLIDMNQKTIMRQKKKEIIDFVNKKNWLAAFFASEDLVGDQLNQPTLFKDFTGLNISENFLNTKQPATQLYWMKYLVQDKIRNIIKVGNRTFNDGSKAGFFLEEDIMQSVAPELIEILSNDYKVLLYGGQLDIIVAPTGVQNFLGKLKWKGVKSYLNSPRKIWKVNRNDSEVAGYVKSVYENETKQFHYVMVRNAGHILTFDQPRAGSDLLDRFINDQLHQF